MRKQIRELLEGQLHMERDRARNAMSHVQRLERDLTRARADHNEAENLVRLIEEELRRPDGSPAAEGGGQSAAETAGSGI